MMRLLAFCLLLATVLWQCNDKQTNTTDSATTQTSSPSVPTSASATAPVASQPYPSISSEKMKYLWDNCDYVDFIMYGTNFSMSQKEQAAIRATLAGISTTPAQVLSNCQPVGRVFFQVDGQNAAEADIFFSLDGNCLYYLFLENGAYTAGNQFTQQAVNFYQQVFTQVSTQAAEQ
ncbi:MAG: hypothetical protein D6772_14450 [Bacteroidetes bacterium]|nr:MAG: hypothetical protein D6772_14450 [Bacteroidota bacterium]